MGIRRRDPGSSLAFPIIALLLATGLLSSCEADTGAVPTLAKTPTAASDGALRFAVFGTGREIAAYEALIAVYNTIADGPEVVLESYPSREAFMGTIRESRDVPDVFLTSERDLAWLDQNRVLQPVDSLLIERGVDFGDLYSRDAVLAFSTQSRLQCMPVGISPMVLFYNPDLVDFDSMALRGLPVPDEKRLTWGFDAFTAAVEFASRPRRGTRGIHVDPTVEALAPFIYAGGGKVFDDSTSPTSLAFSDEGTRSALATALQILRDPRLTLSDEQLAKRSPEQWFEQGKLAMIPGYRDEVPALRQVPGLSFDVISMPGIERAATVGEVSGMCVSAETADAAAAADFLVHMATVNSVRRVVDEGYLVPANLQVAFSPDFVQPGRSPAHAQVFTNAIRTIVLPPLLDDQAGLELAVEESLTELLTAPILTDLELLTTQIDLESRSILDPEGLAQEQAQASESPSG